MNYQRVYKNLITRAQSRVYPSCYYEKHHIVPKSINGTDSQDNLVYLTVKEHKFAHILLYRIFRNEFPNLIYAVYAFYNDANKQRIELRRERRLVGWLRRAKALRDAYLLRELGKLKAAAWNNRKTKFEQNIFNPDDEA